MSNEHHASYCCMKPSVNIDAAGIKPAVGEIAEVLMMSPDTVKKLRFYDPVQVPDYDTLVNRQLTPEEEAVQWRKRNPTHS